MYTCCLQLTCKNVLINVVVSWVVDTWKLQLTCKNAVINPVVSWVVDTWSLQLKCKSVLIKARAVASGGGVGGGSCPPWTCWARQIKFVDGFVFFRLSYFDCSDLQLFAIFMAEKLVGPRCVQVVSKRKQKPLLRFSSPHQLVVFLVKDPPSLLSVFWSYGHVLQWKKKVLAASHFIVEPTTCQSQRIFMKENQTGNIVYRLVSQASCSILKFLVSVQVLGCTVSFNYLTGPRI